MNERVQQLRDDYYRHIVHTAHVPWAIKSNVTSLRWQVTRLVWQGLSYGEAVTIVTSQNREMILAIAKHFYPCVNNAYLDNHGNVIAMVKYGKFHLTEMCPI